MGPDWIVINLCGISVVAILVIEYFERRIVMQSIYEHHLNQEYRALCKKMPIEALMGREIDLSDDEDGWKIGMFYAYFDLCNEMVGLGRNRRIRTLTWKEWYPEIRLTMEKPAFSTAWKEVMRYSPGRYSRLGSLIREQAVSDSVENRNIGST